MEKLQRRLRLFIVLAMLSGLATVVFVSRAHAQTSTAPFGDEITLADIGLDSAPPNGAFNSWWDNLTDKVHLVFTFNTEKKTKLELKIASKDLARLDNTDTSAKVEALLINYRRAIADISTKLSKSDINSATHEEFLSTILAHQGYLAQLENSSNIETKQKFEATRGQNWERLNTALQKLSPEQLAAKIQSLRLENPIQILRRATLLTEWQKKLNAEQQVQIKTVIKNLGEKLRSVPPTQAATLAEKIGELTSDATIQVNLGKLLEGAQPSLNGLTKQLAEPMKPNQRPNPSLAPELPPLNVTITALTAQQLDERRRELADATTKDELLALRQKWYGSQILYRQLYQFHHGLLDQLNAKLVTAMGKGPKPTPAPVPTSPDNITPLPTQQLTPQQQQMGQAYIESMGLNSDDLPPPEY